MSTNQQQTVEQYLANGGTIKHIPEGRSTISESVAEQFYLAEESRVLAQAIDNGSFIKR